LLCEYNINNNLREVVLYSPVLAVHHRDTKSISEGCRDLITVHKRVAQLH
jgi:hypothetical protein